MGIGEDDLETFLSTVVLYSIGLKAIIITSESRSESISFSSCTR